ncbi:hypothetical protein [Frankia sp. AgB32]|uniref:hypothetical protein n=1 Tax=Frankia sp. AgB32 TaxID=631119 RepID=UPI00200EC528|nr:hypothetical protein [Frankia sp. AgB32]MCK9896063.1 hypothetical protein [Frankia sp. AgB32]
MPALFVSRRYPRFFRGFRPVRAPTFFDRVNRAAGRVGRLHGNPSDPVPVAPLIAWSAMSPGT